jgi:hypothetical protein
MGLMLTVCVSPEQSGKEIDDMLANPCQNCSRKDKDKNHRACTQCRRRLDYVAGLDRVLGSPYAYADERIATFARPLTTCGCRLGRFDLG